MAESRKRLRDEHDVNPDVMEAIFRLAAVSLGFFESCYSGGDTLTQMQIVGRMVGELDQLWEAGKSSERYEFLNALKAAMDRAFETRRNTKSVSSILSPILDTE